MRRLLDILVAAVMCLAAANCSTGTAPAADQYVTVGPDGEFRIGDHTYNYIGTNFWYGALLASEGRGGDRARLARELDTLKALGLTNLRIMVGGDGRENVPHHIMPVLQTAPGVYNDTLLAGLDYLLAELERRGMKAVLYLNNAWEWSGGYGAYLEWAGMGDCPDPADGYREYCDYVAQFVLCDTAKAMAANHVRNIVSRTNTVTGRPYSESPAIMAWQIANEPRAFCSDSLHKEAFARWISSTAELIKSLDPNHLVSTGSEGLYGCEVDLDLWERIHRDPNIDYGIIHVWPYNWRWVDSATVVTGVDSACIYALEYITPHAKIMHSAGKPLVVEEFGYPRDGMAIAPGTPTTGRDRFYEYMLSLTGPDGPVAGCNFWGWGGFAEPVTSWWLPGHPYTADPAQEPQGLYSVFASDTSTIKIISKTLKKKHL